ncbi:unnamed protein product [Agarophyton chilense]
MTPSIDYPAFTSPLPLPIHNRPFQNQPPRSHTESTKCNLYHSTRTKRSPDSAIPATPTSTTRTHLLNIRALHPDDARLFDALTPSRAQLFSRVLTNRTRHFTFVLDGVQGAHNLAAIVRSCDAYGIQDLHILTNPYPQNNPNTHQQAAVQNMSVLQRFEHDQSVRQVSKGCHKWLTIAEHNAAHDCVKNLKQAGYRVIVSSVSPSSKPLSSIDLSTKCAFVFGNERNGVTQLIMQHADDFFTIPMMGFVESMNVSVAVATTACLIMHRVHSLLPSPSFLLSAEQRRQLAHTWLTKRQPPHPCPKLLPTKRDMTRLGVRQESTIISNGLFCSVQDASLSDAQYWQEKLRLDVNTGIRISKYLAKRKFGALGDNDFGKRCQTICDGLSGTHALTYEVVRRSERFSTTRKGLFNYFKRLCQRVSASYQPYFDKRGVPLLPPFAPESQAKLEQVRLAIPKICYSVCLDAARTEWGLSKQQVDRIIESTRSQHYAHCILDTIQCNEQVRRAQFLDYVRHGANHSQRQVYQLVSGRYPDGTLLSLASAVRLGHESICEFTTVEKDALHAFLRLSQAAYICSEIHFAVWSRESKADHLHRVHSPRFGLLESVLCDAYSDMVMLNASQEVAIARLVFEFDQVLAPLKHHLAANSGTPVRFEAQKGCLTHVSTLV